MITFDTAMSLLSKAGQAHVLKYWNDLDDKEKKNLLAQIEEIDFQTLSKMRDLLRQKNTVTLADIRPAKVINPDCIDRESLLKEGESLIASGKVGVLLVAGGQGSRLGFEGPKGMFSIGPVSNASLFEIHSRKILALQRKYKGALPLYVMTSQSNDYQTRKFFSDKNYFGLDPESVHFFVQGMWPALDNQGLMIMENKSRIFMSPDGHGGILAAMKRSGVLENIIKSGLTTLFYFQVDNPLVDVADPLFIGLHASRKADVSVKVCAKRSPQEPLGVVVEKNGKHAIVEYSELSEEQKNARDNEGNLKFLYGSVAIHVFSVEFLLKEIAADIPIHIAHKKVPTIDTLGNPVKPDKPNGYKFEKFIFDVIPDADKVINLAFKREDEFSPVKNAEGPDSPMTAKNDMILKFARWLDYCNIDYPKLPSGKPSIAIEIDPCYALTASDLKSKISPEFKVKGDLLLKG